MTKNITNILYSILPPLIKTGLMAIAGIIMAKEYGATLFGYFSYSMALYYFLNNFSKFAMDTVLPKVLLDNPNCAKSLAVKSFIFMFLMAVLFYSITIYTVLYIANLPHTFSILILSCTASILFAAFEVPVYWQNSKHETKMAGLLRALILMVGSLVKIYIAITGADIVYIGYATFIEFLCFAIIYSILFFKFKYKNEYTKTEKATTNNSYIYLTRCAFYPFLMSLCYILYTRLDVFMLQYLSTDIELGTYALAARISEMTFFISTATVGVMIPRLTAEKNKENIQSIYLRYTSFMLYIATAASIGALVILYILSITIFSEGYPNLMDIGIIHAWSNIPSFLIISTGAYLISQNESKLALIRSASIVVVNLVLNYIWIPTHGGQGAAFATLIAYFTFILPLLIDKQSRGVTAKVFTQAFNPKHAIDFVRKL